MTHFAVNAVRPIIAYILGVLTLCAFGWAMSQNLVAMPFVLSFPYKREIAFGLFALAAVCGIVAILKNLQRAEKPWAVSRAQVNRFFGLFMVFTLCAIFAAH